MLFYSLCFLFDSCKILYFNKFTDKLKISTIERAYFSQNYKKLLKLAVILCKINVI